MILQELKDDSKCFRTFHQLQVGVARLCGLYHSVVRNRNKISQLRVDSPGLQLLVVDGLGLLKLDGKLLHGGVQRLLVAREVCRDGVVEK